MTPVARREAVRVAGEAYGQSERHACDLVGVGRGTVRYRSRRPPDDTVRTRLRALASERPRAGYRTLWRCLRREGHRVNHKRVHRLYRLEGLALRRRGRKKRAAAPRTPIAQPTRRGERWSMDFMRDTFTSGRPFRTFNVVDDLTRENHVIEVDRSLPGRARRARLGPGRRRAWIPSGDRVRQRPGIHRPRARSMGVSARRAASLHSAWTAGAKRVHRELQRPIPRRMSRPALVSRSVRRAPHDRSVARRLQHAASAWFAARCHARRVCQLSLRALAGADAGSR